MKYRESWLDYLRAFACILVTLGHLLMSFQDAHIIQQGLAVSIFVELIYCFHVYIFFFCSGFLFQNKTLKSSKEIHTYKIERSINFIILYVVFSGVTYAVKLVFSSDVNSAVEYTFFDTLLKHPINQMWYLYAISLIYLFAYPIQTKKLENVVICIALLIRIMAIGNSAIQVPVNYLFQNMIWFVMGQVFAYRKIKLNKSVSLSVTFLFVIIFAIRSMFALDSDILNTVLTFLGIVASAGVVIGLTKNKTTITGPIKYIAKYMLQIYLLHTICAAGIRIILLKVGITHIIPHFVLGIVFSFIIPMTCAMVAERIKFLNIFFSPTKSIKCLFSK